MTFCGAVHRKTKLLEVFYLPIEMRVNAARFSRESHRLRLTGYGEARVHRDLGFGQDLFSVV